MEFIKFSDEEIISTSELECKFYLIRKAFLEISHRIRKIKDDNLNSIALSDILFFYAFTYTYFTSYDYASVSSEKVNVRKCDVIHPKIYFDKSNVQ